MHYLAMACDFDETLAHEGAVADDVVAALGRLRQSRRRLIMVTGRDLAELRATFSHLELFDAVVVENGAVLYSPATGCERPLATPPPVAFLEALRSRGVSPVHTGRVIVATRTPYETQVLQAIRDLGLELQVVFNRDAVMVLPSGINKATGLIAALEILKIPPYQVVAVGDAENDHALLDAVGFGVAVANAVPMLQTRAQWVTTGDDGRGVMELIERLLENDLGDFLRRPQGTNG